MVQEVIDACLTEDERIRHPAAELQRISLFVAFKRMKEAVESDLQQHFEAMQSKNVDLGVPDDTRLKAVEQEYNKLQQQYQDLHRTFHEAKQQLNISTFPKTDFEVSKLTI